MPQWYLHAPDSLYSMFAKPLNSKYSEAKRGVSECTGIGLVLPQKKKQFTRKWLGKIEFPSLTKYFSGHVTSLVATEENGQANKTSKTFHIHTIICAACTSLEKIQSGETFNVAETNTSWNDVSIVSKCTVELCKSPY